MFLSRWIDNVARRLKLSARRQRQVLRCGRPSGTSLHSNSLLSATQWLTAADWRVENLEQRALLTNSPVFTASGPFSINENTATSATVIANVDANDGDGGIADAGITYSITSGNTNFDGDSILPFAINPTTGAITVTDSGDLDREQIAAFNLMVTASDGIDPNTTTTVTINLIDVKEFSPVVTAAQSATINENLANGSSVLTVVATDGDATATLSGWTIVSGTGATAFAIDASTGAVTVLDSAQLNYETTTSFSLLVTVSDGVNTSAERTVTINLAPVNDNTPVANADSITLNEGGTAMVLVSTATSVLGNDTDADLPGDTLTVASVNGVPANVGMATATTHGSVTVNANGTFSYTHDGSENFTDSFTDTVFDGVNTSSAATVSIAINPVNDNTPVANDTNGNVTDVFVRNLSSGSSTFVVAARSLGSSLKMPCGKSSPCKSCPIAGREKRRLETHRPGVRLAG